MATANFTTKPPMLSWKMGSIAEFITFTLKVKGKPRVLGLMKAGRSRT
jgi:hypothetical protein